jgi:hypothetical protein
MAVQGPGTATALAASPALRNHHNCAARRALSASASSNLARRDTFSSVSDYTNEWQQNEIKSC